MNSQCCNAPTATRQEGDDIVVHCTACGGELGRIRVGNTPPGR